MNGIKYCNTASIAMLIAIDQLFQYCKKYGNTFDLKYCMRYYNTFGPYFWQYTQSIVIHFRQILTQNTFLQCPGSYYKIMDKVLQCFLANVNVHVRYMLSPVHVRYMLSPVRLSVCRLSVICLSVVCNVRAPYSGGSNFRQYFYIVRYLGHPSTSSENFTEIVPGNPSAGKLNTRGVAKYSDFGPIDGYISETVQDRR